MFLAALMRLITLPEHAVSNTWGTNLNFLACADSITIDHEGRKCPRSASASASSPVPLPPRRPGPHPRPTITIRLSCPAQRRLALHIYHESVTISHFQIPERRKSSIVHQFPPRVKLIDQKYRSQMTERNPLRHDLAMWPNSRCAYRGR